AADKTFTPATIPCSPTRTRWTFVITCAAPIDITPGKVQPGIGAADSAAPVAMMTVLLCISSDCVWVRKESSNFSIRWTDTSKLIYIIFTNHARIQVNTIIYFTFKFHPVSFSFLRCNSTTHQNVLYLIVLAISRLHVEIHQ